MTQKTVKYQFKVTRRLVIRRNKTNWTFEKKLLVMHLWLSIMYVLCSNQNCTYLSLYMQADISACPFFKIGGRPRPSGVERWERFPATAE